MKPNHGLEDVVKSRPLQHDESGVLVSLAREQAGWPTISFAVHRRAEGQVWQGNTGEEEVALVLLGGVLSIDWGEGFKTVGGRMDVFSGYPHAVYLPCRTSFEVRALTKVELAEARVPSQAPLHAFVVTPDQVTCEIRGGGNATRQILYILPPGAEADKLLICEVFSPSGNWSSYPPHKHDVHNPPAEVDLDEIYYFRIDHPDGFAFQRLYNSTDTRDATITARDGDIVLIRDGYHPVVAAPGYRVYYLNVLAGSARSMAASDDPRYVHIRRNWPPADARVPVVNRD